MEGKIRFLAVAFVLCCLSGVASADKTIAHSQSLGMSFIAKGEPWCQKQVQVQIEGNDASKFSTDAFKTIIKKLGKVLVEECPAVKMFEIVAHVDRGVVWSGTAKKTDGWSVVSTVQNRVPMLAGNTIPQRSRNSSNDRTTFRAPNPDGRRTGPSNSISGAQITRATGEFFTEQPHNVASDSELSSTSGRTPRLKVQIDPKLENLTFVSRGDTYTWRHVFDYYNKYHAVERTKKPYRNYVAFEYVVFKNDDGEVYVASIRSATNNTWHLDEFNDVFSIAKLPLDKVIKEVLEDYDNLTGNDYVERKKAVLRISQKYPGYGLLADHLSGNIHQTLSGMKEWPPEFHFTYAAYEKSYQEYLESEKLVEKYPFGEFHVAYTEKVNFFAKRVKNETFIPVVDVSPSSRAKGYAASVSSKECIWDRTIRLTVPSKAALQQPTKYLRYAMHDAIHEGCISRVLPDTKKVQIQAPDGKTLGEYVRLDSVLVPTGSLNIAGGRVISSVGSDFFAAGEFASLYHLMSKGDLASVGLTKEAHDLRHFIYLGFVWIYPLECRSSLKGVDRIDKTIVTKDGFGNTTGRRKNEYEVEAGQGATVIRVLENYGSGLYEAAAQKTVRKIVDKYGCDSDEVQAIRRTVYRLGREL